MFKFILDPSLGHTCAYKKSLKVTHFIYTISISHSSPYATKILLELGESHILPSTSPKGDYHCDGWLEVARSQRR